MPFEVMDQRGVPTSPHYLEDVRLPVERKIGFWNSNTVNNSDKMATSSPIDRPLSNMSRHQEGRTSSLSESSWNSMDPRPKSSYEMYMLRMANGNGTNTNLIPQESSLFSSSLSEIYTRKLRLSRNGAPSNQTSKIVDSLHEEEPFESLKEIEAQTIGNLLPDEDDLFSGVIGDTSANRGEELDDFDLFSSGGGMELEGDDRLGASNGEHPHGEHPSRTLFVRNINSNVEDSDLKALFGQYGDVRTLYTACKHRGFVMISYYDIRAARNAIRALQNKPLRRRRLDIHYSIPKDNLSEKDFNQGTLAVFNLDSSVPTEELQRIFGVFGDIKEIREAPNSQNHKFIEFYDVRAAEAALRVLNRSDIAGKQIKLEPDQTYMDNGSTHVLNNVIRSPVMEPNRSSNIPINLASPARMASANNQLNLRELNQSLDEIKFGNQCITGFQPHSLPEYHDNVAKSLPSNSSSSIARHLMEQNGAVFGSPANGNHFPWGNSNQHQQRPASGMIWPNSPSFVNGIRLQHMPNFPRVMLNAASPVHHHIGSAPPVNSPLWDRRHGSPDLGSLGSVGFHGTSPSAAEIAAHNMFPRGNGGNNGVIRSPRQMAHHLFPGRSMPGSFDPPNERVRHYSHRRNESNPNNAADRKQFELDIDRIMRGEDNRTTLMLRNIPNKYTSKMLLAAIDEQCRGTYDFIYLPIDFKNKCNVGYAFINMIDPHQIISFYKAFNGKKWEKFNSEKVATLAFARIQGKSALIAHFQNSSLMNEDKRCRPILFHTAGPNAGDQEPFPMGSNVRSRPGKARAARGEEPSNGTDSSSGSD